MRVSSLDEMRRRAQEATRMAEETRVLAEEGRVRAVEMARRVQEQLERLSRRLDRAGAAERSGELGEDRQVGVEPHSLDAADAEAQ
jgi:hypothetical protein